MKDGNGGNVGLNREYYRKLFGPMFYSWCICPLILPPKLLTVNMTSVHNVTVRFIFYGNMVASGND